MALSSQSSTPSDAQTESGPIGPAAMQPNPPAALGRQRGRSAGQAEPSGPVEQVDSTVEELPSPEPVVSAPSTKPPSTSLSANPSPPHADSTRLPHAESKALLHRTADHAARAVRRIEFIAALQKAPANAVANIKAGGNIAVDDRAVTITRRQAGARYARVKEAGAKPPIQATPIERKRGVVSAHLEGTGHLGLRAPADCQRRLRDPIAVEVEAPKVGALRRPRCVAQLASGAALFAHTHHAMLPAVALPRPCIKHTGRPRPAIGAPAPAELTDDLRERHPLAAQRPALHVEPGLHSHFAASETAGKQQQDPGPAPPHGARQSPPAGS